MDEQRESDEDDVPQLSEQAIAALMEFYAEQQAGDKLEHNSAVKEDWVRIQIFEINYKFTIRSQHDVNFMVCIEFGARQISNCISVSFSCTCFTAVESVLV